VLAHPESSYQGVVGYRDFSAPWRELGYPILPDPAATVSATYGAAFQRLVERTGWWTNRPAIFVIDRDGVIRFEYRANANRPDPRGVELYQVLDGLAEKRTLLEALREKDD